MRSKRTLSLVTVVALCLNFLMPASVYADNAITGGSNVGGAPNTSIAIPDWQVTGSGTIPVHLYVPSGVLSMTTTAGITFTSSATGSNLYFSGSLADVNAALATLHYTNGSNGTFTIEMSLVNAGQVYYPANGHIYEVVNNGSNITGGAARSAALARSINGVSGYLATITSAEENAFISGRLTSDGWFGASDAVTEGTWKWLDGPEAGTTFWVGTSGGTAFGYQNWATGEPNQSGDEDCSEFYANGSGWNDLNCSGAVSSYVVEYGAPGNLVTIPSASLNATIVPDTTPPTLSQTTAVTTPTNTHTPSYTFTTDEAGTITYGGSCSSATTAATVGANTIAFNTLADGTYSNCTIRVTDAAGNASTPLAVSSFTIDTVAPVLTEIGQIPVKTNTADAVYHFSTNEACTPVAGTPSASPVSAVSTVIDNTTTPGTNYTARLSGIQLGGTYSVDFQCRDAAGNLSNTLHVGSFTVIGISGGLGLPAPSQKEETVKVVPPVQTIPQKDTTTPLVIPPVTQEQAKPVTITPTLNAAPEASCVDHVFLTKPIKFGAHNNPEDVKLLEQFLNTYEDAHLPLDSVYSKKDFGAVVKWQEKYTSDILVPWGTKKGTGYVYIKSLAKIKEIEENACK